MGNNEQATGTTCSVVLLRWKRRVAFQEVFRRFFGWQWSDLIWVEGRKEGREWRNWKNKQEYMWQPPAGQGYSLFLWMVIEVAHWSEWVSCEQLAISRSYSGRAKPVYKALHTYIGHVYTLESLYIGSARLRDRWVNAVYFKSINRSWFVSWQV